MLFAGAAGIIFITLGGLGYFAGPLFILTTVYTLTSLNGTEFSTKNGYVKAYTSSFGIKKGKWMPTLYLTDICVLRLGTAVNEEDSKDFPGKRVYELFLMTPDHRKRFFVSATDTQLEAFKIAEDLALKLRKKLSYYHPVVSESTLNKRYERH